MKRLFVMIGMLLLAGFLSACGQGENEVAKEGIAVQEPDTVEEEAEESNEADDREQERDEDEERDEVEENAEVHQEEAADADEAEVAAAEDTDAEEAGLTEEEGQQETESVYQSENFDLELKIVPGLQDRLIVEETGGIIRFAIEDNTILHTTVEIGAIEVLPAGTFGDPNDPPMQFLFKKGADSGYVYGFNPIQDTAYYPADDGGMLPEAEAQMEAAELLEQSLIQSGFLQYHEFESQL